MEYLLVLHLCGIYMFPLRFIHQKTEKDADLIFYVVDNINGDCVNSHNFSFIIERIDL